MFYIIFLLVEGSRNKGSRGPKIYTPLLFMSIGYEEFFLFITVLLVFSVLSIMEWITTVVHSISIRWKGKELLMITLAGLPTHPSKNHNKIRIQNGNQTQGYPRPVTTKISGLNGPISPWILSSTLNLMLKLWFSQYETFYTLFGLNLANENPNNVDKILTVETPDFGCKDNKRGK